MFLKQVLLCSPESLVQAVFEVRSLFLPQPLSTDTVGVSYPFCILKFQPSEESGQGHQPPSDMESVVMLHETCHVSELNASTHRAYKANTDLFLPFREDRDGRMC